MNIIVGVSCAGKGIFSMSCLKNYLTYLILRILITVMFLLCPSWIMTFIWHLYDYLGLIWIINLMLSYVSNHVADTNNLMYTFKLFFLHKEDRTSSMYINFRPYNMWMLHCFMLFKNGMYIVYRNFVNRGFSENVHSISLKLLYKVWRFDFYGKYALQLINESPLHLNLELSFVRMGQW